MCVWAAPLARLRLGGKQAHWQYIAQEPPSELSRLCYRWCEHDPYTLLDSVNQSIEGALEVCSDDDLSMSEAAVPLGRLHHRAWHSVIACV